MGMVSPRISSINDLPPNWTGPTDWMTFTYQPPNPTTSSTSSSTTDSSSSSAISTTQKHPTTTIIQKTETSTVISSSSSSTSSNNVHPIVTEWIYVVPEETEISGDANVPALSGLCYLVHLYFFVWKLLNSF